MPEGVLSSADSTASANSAVDLEIVGADAEVVGRELDRQWNRRFLFDIPRKNVAEVSERVAEIALRRHLDARLVETQGRITHRARIDLALEAGGGAGEVQFHGICGAVIADVPNGEPLRVLGESMPTGHVEEARLRRITIVARGGNIARSERFAYAMVDWGRLLAIDVRALQGWKADEPLDNKADFVFWGRDAERIATRLSANRLSDDEYGWRDLRLSIRGLSDNGCQIQVCRSGN